MKNWTYSLKPGAIRNRAYELTNDAAADRRIARNKAWRNKKRVETLTKERSFFKSMVSSKAKLARVAFHLAKGRDAGDIAVRENWPVSDVLRFISELTPASK
jgi:hypothetical protein